MPRNASLIDVRWLVLSTAFLGVCTSTTCLGSQAEPTFQAETISSWRTLHSRTGWSIQYPSSWTTWSCHNCPDSTASGVYVTFGVLSTDDGTVMVYPLADKPEDQSVPHWLDEVKRSANLNPIFNEQPVSVNGLPGLRVRYKSTSPDIEMDVTYLVAGSKTYEISFDRGSQGKRLEDLPNYDVYRRMVETFRVVNREAR